MADAHHSVSGHVLLKGAGDDEHDMAGALALVDHDASLLYCQALYPARKQPRHVALVEPPPKRARLQLQILHFLRHLCKSQVERASVQGCQTK